MAQTSARVGSLAGKYEKLTPEKLLALTATPELREQTCDEIQSIAATALRQVEPKGLRKLYRRAKKLLHATSKLELP